MMIHPDAFATGPMPACARLVYISGLGTRVEAHRPWNTTHKRTARHLGKVSM